MRAWLRVLAKDLREFLFDLRVIILTIGMPALILLLVGQLQLKTPIFRVLLTGVPDCEEPHNASLAPCKARSLIGQLVTFKATTDPRAESSPLARMQAEGFDAIIQFRPAPNAQYDFALFVSIVDPYRLRTFMTLSAELERTIGTIIVRPPPLPPPPPPSPPPPVSAASSSLAGSEGPATLVSQASHNEGPLAHGPVQSGNPKEAGRLRERRVSEETKDLYGQIISTGESDALKALIYFPEANDRTKGHLPMTIAIIVTFIPFIIAAPTLLKERELHTIEVLLAAPGMRPVWLFLGKCTMPVILTLIDFLLMIVLAQSVYHLYIKSQAWTPIVLLLPAVLSSTFLGIAVSALARSQSQVLLAAAGYFLALALLTGFFYPIDQGPVAVRTLSELFPLTQLRPALNFWMLGDGTMPHLWRATFHGVGQCVGYAIVAMFAYRRMLREL